MNDNPMPSRPLVLGYVDAWAIHDCLTAALAGFGGRHETAEPWHALNLLRKIRPALLALTPATSTTLDFTRGELECIDLNVPRAAYQGAPDLLMRVFRVLEEIAYGMALTPTDPEPDAERRSRLDAWRAAQTTLNGEGGDPV